MNKHWKRILICAAIVLGSVALTLLMSNVQFFKGMDLKAQDAHFVLRGALPTKDIELIEVDDKAQNHYPEPRLFWQPYYADAIRGAAAGGGKVFVLDIEFPINVKEYKDGYDELLAGAFLETNPVMPIVCAFVPGTLDSQQDPRFTVPLNLAASTFGMSGLANLTADSDDFIRKQELIEEPQAGVPTDQLKRGMALLAAEKFLGQDAVLRDGRLFLAGREVAADAERNLTINYAGPPDTFPHVSLYDVVTAYRNKDTAQLEKWFKGKAVLMGPADITDQDRHATPFYTAFLGAKRLTPGVEIHANVLQTLLTADYLKPVPEWARITAMVVAAALCVAAVTSLLGVWQTALWSTLVMLGLLVGTHLLFRRGWLLSTSQTLLAFAWALLGGIIYRFATAEKKSSFFKSAVALFVGRQVATSLDESEKISLTGKREMVTILFTDIRGFTAFCESKDPAVVVDLLNVYMSTMVSIIVKYGGHVNKFIGDGILAVFSDDDPGAQPGDHALRTVKCAAEMVDNIVGEFKTGSGMHSGEVVIGNVGSSDKLEFTVLGNTVNLASRLESLNKDQHTRLLMSEETREMLGGAIDTIYLGAVPVKGKTEKMKLFTVTSLLEDSRVAELRAAQAETLV
jgi:adenylate cyclase